MAQVDTWNVSLELNFRGSNGRTPLARSHHGPLQVQKALYPEGDAVCHAIVIHPPGGIAGGDRLDIDVTTDAGAHALIATPGATRWYEANGRTAHQNVRLRVHGALEWLPQQAIVFDAADVGPHIDIDLAPDAVLLGRDIVALGRRAAGETFTSGCFAQSIRLSVDGELQWVERTRIVGGDALLDSPIGLDGRRAFGCLWACGPHRSETRIEAVRARVPNGANAPALTQLAPRLLVARVLAQSRAMAHDQLTRLWDLLRPMTVGRAAHEPRIWST